MSPESEGEWLDYITGFERQFENARQITVRERIGDPQVKPLSEISGFDLADKLDRLLELLFQNSITIDFLHEQSDLEMYRSITEELLNEETDNIRIPGMISHFIYEEFHPNDEDDITDAIEEFLYALFHEEFRDPAGMHYHILSQENMHDSYGSPISLEDFYDAYPVLTGYNVEMKTLQVGGDHAVVQANIEWHGMPRDEKAVLKREGLSEFRLVRSSYGGWDIIQVNIPGWAFQAKA